MATPTTIHQPNPHPHIPHKKTHPPPWPPAAGWPPWWPPPPGPRAARASIAPGRRSQWRASRGPARGPARWPRRGQPMTTTTTMKGKKEKGRRGQGLVAPSLCGVCGCVLLVVERCVCEIEGGDAVIVVYVQCVCLHFDWRTTTNERDMTFRTDLLPACLPACLPLERGLKAHSPPRPLPPHFPFDLYAGAVPVVVGPKGLISISAGVYVCGGGSSSSVPVQTTSNTHTRRRRRRQVFFGDSQSGTHTHTHTTPHTHRAHPHTPTRPCIDYTHTTRHTGFQAGAGAGARGRWINRPIDRSKQSESAASKKQASQRAAPAGAAFFVLRSRRHRRARACL
jgi:hypothetical protein